MDNNKNHCNNLEVEELEANLLNRRRNLIGRIGRFQLFPMVGRIVPLKSRARIASPIGRIGSLF